MSTKTLAAPKKLRKRDGRDPQIIYGSMFSVIGADEAFYMLRVHEYPNGGCMLGHFNAYSQSVSRIIEIIEEYAQEQETKTGFKLRDRFKSAPIEQMTCAEYAQFLMDNMRDLGCAYDSISLPTMQVLRNSMVVSIEGIINSMYPVANFLQILGGHPQAKVLAKIGDFNVIVYFRSTLYLLMNNNLLSKFSAMVNFNALFEKIFLKYTEETTVDNKHPQFNDDITIGMDPELEAYYITEDGPDFDLQCIAGKILKNGGGRVGCDGHSDIFELRPMHHKDPKRVVLNTQKCFDILGYTLAGLEKPVYLLTGGGIIDSIGGHIHLGGTFFTKISSDEISAFFGSIMDDFVYWPMRDKMPGALRSWGNHSDLARKAAEGRRCGLPDKKPSVVFDKISKANVPRNMHLAGYEVPSAFRFPSYGAEYRSLPSFIANPELTGLVLTMARCAAKKMLLCYNEVSSFTYNCPPKKNDYLSLFPEGVYHAFMRYINGEKNRIFLSNALDNWGANPSSYEPVVKISGYSQYDTTSMGIHVSKAMHPYIQSIKKRYTELDGLRCLSVLFCKSTAVGGPYGIRTGNILYGEPEDIPALKSSLVADNSISSKNATVLFNPEDLPGPTIPMVDALSLAIAQAIGIDKLGIVKKQIKEYFPTFETVASFRPEIVVLDNKEATTVDHTKTSYTDQEWEIAMNNCQFVCRTYKVKSRCRCLYCQVMQEYRSDSCDNCPEESCPNYDRDNEEHNMDDVEYGDDEHDDEYNVPLEGCNCPACAEARRRG